MIEHHLIHERRKKKRKPNLGSVKSRKQDIWASSDTSSLCSSKNIIDEKEELAYKNSSENSVGPNDGHGIIVCK